MRPPLGPLSPQTFYSCCSSLDCLLTPSELDTLYTNAKLSHFHDLTCLHKTEEREREWGWWGEREREGKRQERERQRERERERKETVESGLCIFTLQISQVLLKGKTNLASGTRACSLCRVGSQPRRRVEHRLSYQSYSICHNIPRAWSMCWAKQRSDL